MNNREHDPCVTERRLHEKHENDYMYSTGIMDVIACY